MLKALKFFQYAYIIFAVMFAWDAISNWSIDRSRSYISLLFAALAVWGIIDPDDLWSFVKFALGPLEFFGIATP